MGKGAIKKQENKWTGPLVGVLMGGIALAIGIWVIHMGIEGRTPAETLGPKEKPGLIAFGALFAWGGVMTLVLATVGERLPRWGHVILLSGFIICLATPFILSAILTPEQISSTVTLNDRTVHDSMGGGLGQIVFLVVGVLLLIGLPFLIKWMIPKNTKRSS